MRKQLEECFFPAAGLLVGNRNGTYQVAAWTALWKEQSHPWVQCLLQKTFPALETSMAVVKNSWNSGSQNCSWILGGITFEVSSDPNLFQSLAFWHLGWNAKYYGLLTAWSHLFAETAPHLDFYPIYLRLFIFKYCNSVEQITLNCAFLHSLVTFQVFFQEKIHLES